MNYGIQSAAVPHYDHLLQRVSQRPSGGLQSAQGWHTNLGRTSSSTSIGNQLIGLCPMPFGEVSVLEQLGFEVVTAVAATTGKIGLYDSDITGMPAQLRGYFGVIDTTAVGFKTVQVGATLEPGLFWAALWASSSSSAFRSYEGSHLDALNQVSGGLSANSFPASGYLTSIAFVEFPGYMGSARLTGMSPAPRASWKVSS